jgi:hypothetical protein
MRVRVQSGEQEMSDGEASKKDSGRRRLDMHTAKHSVDCAAVSIQGVRWALEGPGRRGSQYLGQDSCMPYGVAEYI